MKGNDPVIFLPGDEAQIRNKPERVGRHSFCDVCNLFDLAPLANETAQRTSRAFAVIPLQHNLHKVVVL